MEKVEVEKLVEDLKGAGFERWYEDSKKLVLGRELYRGGITDTGSVAADWEEWVLYKKDKVAVHKYETNRTVPGWEMCPACGEWYQSQDAERHEGCQVEKIKLE
ncbi:MAG: hypothetical protein J7M14_00575 [Planctomycetes bacterium]|nr:hypothetical protein [Planctomycetota bacterium]